MAARRRGPRGALGRAEQATARGGDPPGRPSARRRRCRVGKDEGAHPPHRLHGRLRARRSLAGAGDHLHQQGRRRDAEPLCESSSAAPPTAVGLHVPLGVRPHPPFPRPTGSGTAGASPSTTTRTAAVSSSRSSATSASHETARAAGGPGRDIRGQGSNCSTSRPTSPTRNIHERTVGDIYAEYQQRLHSASSMDFDDF